MTPPQSPERWHSKPPQAGDTAFASWAKRNLAEHKVDGYRAVFLSLKSPNAAPGDMSAEQMDAVADLADAFSLGELRTTHDQNLVFADVRTADLYPLWKKLAALDLATPNIGLITDLICCPGLDFCSLANAGSIGVAADIHERFDSLDLSARRRPDQTQDEWLHERLRTP